MDLVFFTVIENFKSLDGQHEWSSTTPTAQVIGGSVRFTPLIMSGDTLQGVDMVPPTSLVLGPVVAQIVNGQITRNGVPGCRLTANTGALHLSGDLYYRAEYFNLVDQHGVAIRRKSFDFLAKKADEVLDLVTVTPVAGTYGQGSIVGPAGPGGGGVARSIFSAGVGETGVTAADRAPSTRTLTEARMRVSSAPQGSDLVAHVQHFDGAAWSDIAVLTVADGSLAEAIVPLSQVQDTDDLLRLNVTSVGSAVAATGIVVEILWG